MKDELSKHFTNLQLPDVSQQWLLNVWDALQGLDDWYDNDEVDSQQKQQAIYTILVELPNNPFYAEYRHWLTPLMSSLVLKWCGANQMEEKQEHNAVSYVWRAAYYDLVLMVVNIVHGFDVASKASSYVAKMYGEPLEAYLKEFDNA